jgi:hypothetical protein
MTENKVGSEKNLFLNLFGKPLKPNVILDIVVGWRKLLIANGFSEEEVMRMSNEELYEATENPQKLLGKFIEQKQEQLKKIAYE